MSAKGPGFAFGTGARRRRHRVALTLGLVLALAAPAAAQRLPFANFDADDALPSSQIWAIAQDSRGLLWIGTSWGLARHDGERFSSLALPEGLPSLTVRAVVEAEDGSLWIGTNAGVARYDGRSISTFTGGGAPDGTVWAATRDDRGGLWFGTNDGLFRFADGGFRRFGAAEGLPSAYVYALLASADGSLWIGTRGAGAVRCRPQEDGGLGACEHFAPATSPVGAVVRALAEDARGRILVGSRDRGLAVLDGGSWRGGDAVPALPSDDVYALLARRDGTVVVGTADHGLVVCIDVAARRCRPVDERNGLADDGVRRLFEDREGSLWVGTEGGLSRLGPDEIWSYGETEGLPDGQVDSLAVAPDGALWVGTFDGLAELRLGSNGEPSVRVWRRSDGLPGRWVWAILHDRRGRAWVGTEGGLCRLDAGGCQVWGRAQGLPDDYVLSLAEDPAGGLWVGTTDGLARIADGEAGPRVERVWRRADGLFSNRCYALAVDAVGRLWVAHGEGISVSDGERFRVITSASGLPAGSVRSLGLARDGSLLAGGFGHLSRVLPGAGPPRFGTWGEAAGLGGVLVLNALELEGGRLLLGTNRGVLVLDPEASGGQGAVLARFDRRDGAAGSEVTNSAALVRDRQGRAWFGFKGGLSGFPERLFDRVAEPPPVAIVALTSQRGRSFRLPFTAVATRPMGWLGEAPPELPADDDAVRVEVRALAFADRGDLRFQIRLEGAEETWPEPRPEPFRDFNNLEPGRYVVAARAARGGSAWGPEARLSFVVQPAWWQRPAFRAAAAVALAAALAALARWRWATAGRRTRALEQEIAERTDDLARYARALAEHLQAVDRDNARSRRDELDRREMFARTSHELRTPLTAILGFSELLERSLGDRLESRERRYLANVRDGGEQLLRLVNNLLDQIKLESGRMELHLEEIEPSRVAESVVSLMEGFALHRRVRLETRIVSEPPPARSDVAKLRQILLNLLSNAVKFSPPGEVVTLSVRALAEADTGLGTAGFEMAVVDRGPGIDPAEREAIFEPYRQLSGSSSVTAGTGLGLPIARQLVELLGGRLALESETGRGSIFRVVLPLDPLARNAEAAAAGEAARLEPGRVRVLVIEPDRPRFARLARQLEHEDLLAVRAGDVEEAERMIPGLHPAALAVRFDPTRPAEWRRVEAVIDLAARSRVALSLLAADDEGLGFALSLDAVVGAADVAAGARAALETLGAGERRPRSALVAAHREGGGELVSVLGRLGVEAFRVEGEREVLDAFEESPADLLALDVAHLVRLAPEVGGGRSKPAVALGRPKLLIAGGAPDVLELARLATRLRTEGGEAGRALAGSARALLLRRAAPEVRWI
jgi:signal transduction histidine kinase/ligand-binding sensor domain-containing protein